jgi:hypothetical protein
LDFHFLDGAFITKIAIAEIENSTIKPPANFEQFTQLIKTLL